MNDATKTRIRISQETIAVVTVGLALAALVVTSTGRVSERLDRNVAELRAEARADRAALRAEARADRAELRAEARADREAFARQILKLTAGQAHLAGLVASPLEDQTTVNAGSE